MTNGLKPSRRGFGCRRGPATVTNSRPWIDHFQSGRGPSRTIGRHRRRSLDLDGPLAPHCRHLFPAAGTPGACPQTDDVSSSPIMRPVLRGQHRERIDGRGEEIAATRRDYPVNLSGHHMSAAIVGFGHYEISLTIFSGYIVLSDNRVVASVWILEVRLVYPVPGHELEPVHNRALIGEEHQATVLDAIILRITRCGGR